MHGTLRVNKSPWLNFIFTLLCGASKGFMKAFKALLTFFSSSGIGTGRVKKTYQESQILEITGWIEMQTAYMQDQLSTLPNHKAQNMR